MENLDQRSGIDTLVMMNLLTSDLTGVQNRTWLGVRTTLAYLVFVTGSLYSYYHISRQYSFESSTVGTVQFTGHFFVPACVRSKALPTIVPVRGYQHCISPSHRLPCAHLERRVRMHG